LDAFVIKLTPDGHLGYSTLFGTADDDAANGVAVDAAGRAYVVGGAGPSSGFPIVSPPGTSALHMATEGAFLAEITADGNGFIFSDFILGGNVARAVALDDRGNIYVAGDSGARVRSSFSSPSNTSTSDAFVVKITTPPVLATVAPTAVLAAGGALVTLSGNGFRQGATVRFGDISVSPSTISTDGTQIVVPAPSHTPGQVDISVTNPDGHGVTLPSAFVYFAANAPAPAVTRIFPTHGTIAGGTAVTITGSGFQSGAVVSFGATSATDVAVSSASTLTATLPAHDPGAVSVVVSNADSQTGSVDAAFTFDGATAAPPTVTAVSNPGGLPGGGYTLTLTGTGFQNNATVTVGGTPATNIDVLIASTLTFTAPAHAEGPVEIVVTNPDGQSGTLTGSFIYGAAKTGCTQGPAAWWSLPVLALLVRRRGVCPCRLRTTLK
jgi:hypothetical protein